MAGISKDKWKSRADAFEKDAVRIFSKVRSDEIRHSSNSSVRPAGSKPVVFIGHGRSPQWRVLKDFLNDKLNLDWDEFNHESAAGISTASRLEAMLERADFAFLIMTAEDVHEDGSLHARENVVHEVGLFQGKLGFKKAIVLLEDGCKEFSNIVGLGQIRFPANDIMARSEQIRDVLERESMI